MLKLFLKLLGVKKIAEKTNEIKVKKLESANKILHEKGLIKLSETHPAFVGKYSLQLRAIYFEENGQISDMFENFYVEAIICDTSDKQLKMKRDIQLSEFLRFNSTEALNYIITALDI